jgi:hypothetical protein
LTGKINGREKGRILEVTTRTSMMPRVQTTPTFRTTQGAFGTCLVAYQGICSINHV